MLFQTLDFKEDCVGIYFDGELMFNEAFPQSLSHTWSYSGFLQDEEVEYAQLYCGGLTIREACPSHLIDRWGDIEEKLKAFIKSFHTARVSLNENCFFDLVPQKFLLEMCYTKDLICRHIFENYEKPNDYDYQLSLVKAINRIKYQKLNINPKALRLHRSKHRKFAQTLGSFEPYCKFNIDGTKTGRLTTSKRSFPILTLDKELRSIVVPQNDYFVELDFNAAEIRTLLALQGKAQPLEDVHEWNIKNIFQGTGTRDEAKRRIFAWLYNPASSDHACEKFYDRGSIVDKHFSDGHVTTFFSKKIDSEKRTALNYIIQSTCAENVLRQMIKVADYLKGSKSFIAFPVHDSIVIDMTLDDIKKVPDLVELFGATELGKFLVNVSAGKTFGALKKVEV